MRFNTATEVANRTVFNVKGANRGRNENALSTERDSRERQTAEYDDIAGSGLNRNGTIGTAGRLNARILSTAIDSYRFINGYPSKSSGLLRDNLAARVGLCERTCKGSAWLGCGAAITVIPRGRYPTPVDLSLRYAHGKQASSCREHDRESFRDFSWVHVRVSFGQPNEIFGSESQQQ